MTKSSSIAESINWEDLIRMAVVAVSYGLRRTETPRDFESSTSPSDKAYPPVMMIARTPCSTAGSWIVGRSPQTTMSFSAGKRSIRSVNPPALMAPTITMSSSCCSGSIEYWKEPPRISRTLPKLVRTVRVLSGSASSRKIRSISCSSDRIPTTFRSSSTTGMARTSWPFIRW